MPRMLAVSDEVRAEIGDDEADRLLAGAHAPDTYDCTSCRTPGDSSQEATSTVLFVGDETAVLAFAHARCVPSQVVPVSEEQLRGAVQSISQAQGGAHGSAVVDGFAAEAVPEVERPTPPAAGQPAVLGITCGLVMCGDIAHAALVVEPTGPVGRPGNTSGEDEFLSLLTDHRFQQVTAVDRAPDSPLPGWSVLMAMGQLHAILQPSATGGSSAWWQAHQPLQVTDSWRQAANKQATVTMYAVPAGTVGRQPREDLLRQALDRAAAKGLLVGAILPLAGT
ncbi:hypothetical protein [Kitasatospora sp. HPMI-4]|uniref:hypothetical protein n=1 Tax=Kitasatospora sp. HPMI-4 TaxID=3448443 RepID=UPI003F1BF7BB